ncbi:MAG: WD40 repeat domain-containing protein, partial [Myxococcales bacterium]|nr:WD40 repeat domain-containing protein [Myxococcales bacterium]
ERLDELVSLPAIVGQIAEREVDEEILAIAATQDRLWIGHREFGEGWGPDGGELIRIDLSNLAKKGKKGTVSLELVAGPDPVIAAVMHGNIQLWNAGEPIGPDFPGRNPRFDPIAGGLTYSLGDHRILHLEFDAESWSDALELANIPAFYDFAPLTDGHALVLTKSGDRGMVVRFSANQDPEQLYSDPKLLRAMTELEPGRLVTVGDDKVARMFALPPPSTLVAAGDLEELSTRPLDGINPTSMFVEASSDGRKLLLGSSNSEAVLTNDTLGLIVTLPSMIRPQFSPDGRWILASDHRQLVLHDTDTGLEVARFPEAAEHFAFAPNGNLYTTEGTRVVHWAVDTQDHWSISASGQGIRAQAFASDDSTTLLLGGTDHIPRRWKVGNELRSDEEPVDVWIVAIGSKAGSERLLTRDGVVWTRRARGSWQRDSSTCRSRVAAFADDLLAARCDDGNVKLWDLTGTTPPKSFQPERPVTALALSPSTSHLALGLDDGSIIVHSPNNGRSRPLTTGKGESVTALAFDADNTLVAGGNDDQVLLWTLGAHEPELVRAVSNDNIDVATIDPGGRWFAAVDDKRKLAVWNRGGDIALQVTVPCSTVYALAAAPDGSRLAAACSDGSVHVWPLSSAAKLELLCRRLAATGGAPPTCETRTSTP